ncbi:MAG: outer membrane beta-barrel protein [Sulfuriferula sp.]|nr:outer membrane beta-barrel protein [Sulfuriferula sp.]
MKTKLAIITLALIPTLAQANEFEGFNVGLGVGYVQPKVTYTDNISGYYQWDKSDYVFQVDAGYDKAISDKWLIGIGVSMDLNNTNAGTQNAAYGPIEAMLKEHYAVYLQPTLMIDNTSAVFAKIGYHAIKVNAIGLPGARWLDDKFRTQGIGYGIGYKRFVSKKLFAQAEIQVVDYDDKLLTDNAGYNWSYQQKTTAGILTLGYKF